MAVVHQEFDAVLLGANGVIGRNLHDLQVGNIQLEAAGDAGRTFFGAHRAADDQRRFLRQAPRRVEHGLADILLEDHRLADAAAVAHLQELQATFVGLVIQPAAQRDRRAHMVFQVLDTNDGHSSLLVAAQMAPVNEQ